MIHDATKGNPSTINYVMFVAIFAMLSLIYLIAATVNEGFAISPFFMLAADALNTLFFLVGGIALAASLNVHSCSNEVCFPGNDTNISQLTRCAELPKRERHYQWSHE